MKRSRLFALVVLLLACLAAVPMVGLASEPGCDWDHYACNCWDHDWICTYETADHEVCGYAYYANGC